VISPFHPIYRTPHEVELHKAQRQAQKVARKLMGLPEPTISPYVPTSSNSLTQHRMKEIEVKTDLGWGDPEAIRLMKHHVANAVARAENHADKWDLLTSRGGPGGLNNLTKRAIQMIEGLLDRIEPSLTVAEAEFDSRGLLRKRYGELVANHIKQLEEIRHEHQELRVHASKHHRPKIRAHEIMSIQKVLDSMASKLRTWADEVTASAREAGFK